MAEKKKRGKNRNWLQGLRPEGFRELIRSKKLYRYKEVCNILNIPVLTSGSNSQTKQLDMLNMLCEYEKEKGKFRFIRIRSEEDIEVFRHQMTYTKLIKYSLAQALLEPETQERMNNGLLFAPMSEIMRMCGMINENFNEIRKASNHKVLAIAMMHYEDFGKHGEAATQLRRFVRVSYDVIKPLVRDAIKSMDNEMAIMVQRAYTVYKITSDGGRIIKHILATSDEGQELFRICSEVLTELEIDKTGDLYYINHSKANEYYRRCNELCKERLGYDEFRDCYAISLSKSRLEHMLNVKYAKALNLKVQDRLSDAKQLDELGTKFKENLINATISLDTSYDFKEDYRIVQEMRAGK